MTDKPEQLCDSAKLSAFYDGELGPAEAAAVRAHVEQCAPCRRELDELQALSRRMAALAGAALPAEIAWSLRNPESFRSRRLVYRTAWSLTYSAAAAMLVGAVCLWQVHGAGAAAGAAPAAWEVAAIAGQPEQHPAELRTSESPDTQLATWMLEGLGKEQR